MWGVQLHTVWGVLLHTMWGVQLHTEVCIVLLHTVFFPIWKPTGQWSTAGDHYLHNAGSAEFHLHVLHIHLHVYMYRCIDIELYTLVYMVVVKWQIVSKRRALNRQSMEWYRRYGLARYAMVYYGLAWFWHGTLLVYQCILWHSLVVAWYAGFRYATISNGVM